MGKKNIMDVVKADKLALKGLQEQLKTTEGREARKVLQKRINQGQIVIRRKLKKARGQS